MVKRGEGRICILCVCVCFGGGDVTIRPTYNLSAASRTISMPP